MGKLSLEDLELAGLGLEDFSSNKEPSNIEVKVSVDTKEIADNVAKSYKSNTELFSSINKTMDQNNTANRVLLNTLIELLSKPKEEKENIRGIRVIRNELNLIDYLAFDKED